MRNYSVAEIAEKLDVNPETVRRWIRSGELKTTFSSRKKGHIISEKDLQDFANDNPKYAKKLGLEIQPRIPIREILVYRLNQLQEERDYINKEIESIQSLLSTMEES